MFFAIILVIGAIALAAYSYFRLNRRTIGFQHFEVRQRKTGPWGWGFTLNPSPSSGLLQQTGCFRELAECLARFLSPGRGLCPEEISSGSSRALYLAESEDGGG